MAESTCDHERLDVHRLSFDCVAFSYRIAKTLMSVNRPARDQWLRAAQSIPLDIAEGNGKQSLRDKNRFFGIARGSALSCLNEFVAADRGTGSIALEPALLNLTPRPGFRGEG